MNSHDMNILKTVTIISSILSIFGCSLILFFYILLPQLRIFNVRLLVYISFFDLIAALSNLLYFRTDDVQLSNPFWMCELQARLQQMFYLASYLMILCYIYHFYNINVNKERCGSKFEYLYLFISWLVALLLSIIIEMMGGYGETDVWCWITPNHYALRWLFFYIPEIIIIIIISQLLLSSFKPLKLLHNLELIARPNQLFTASGTVQMEIRAYFIVFILIRIPGLIHRWLEMIQPHENISFSYLLFHATLSPLQGFLNCMLFLSNGYVRSFIRTWRFRHRNKSLYDQNDIDSSDLQALLTPTAIKKQMSYIEPFPNNILNRDIQNIFIGTWNLGKYSPPTIMDLKQWLPSKNNYDIYAIGTQELSYENEYHSCVEHWHDLLLQVIGKNDHHILISHQIGSLDLVIIIKKKLKPFIINIDICEEATGVANLGTNKGGIAISFKLGRLSLCFINVHLAAFRGQQLKRNRNILQIFKRLNFKYVKHYSEFHTCFLFGDLNYRLNLSSRDIILQYIKDENWNELCKYDELNNLRENGCLLNDFIESELIFPPTYKFNVKTNNYNKKRLPAYCDRVLCYHRENVYVQHTLYNCVPQILTSDHKPVKCCFRVAFRGLESRSTTPTTIKKNFFSSSNDDNNNTTTHKRNNISIDYSTAVDEYGEATSFDRYCIILTNLVCSGAIGTFDMPLIDPYLIINGKIISKYNNGFPIWNGVSADDQGTLVWENSSILPIYIDNGWNSDNLENYYIRIELRDAALIGYDNDLIGSCIVELENSIDCPKSFQQRIYNDSKYNGILSGKIWIKINK